MGCSPRSRPVTWSHPNGVRRSHPWQTYSMRRRSPSPNSRAIASAGWTGLEIASSRPLSPQSARRARSKASGCPSPDRTRAGQRDTSSARAILTVREASCDADPAAAKPIQPPPATRRSFQLARAPGPDRGDGKRFPEWRARVRACCRVGAPGHGSRLPCCLPSKHPGRRRLHESRSRGRSAFSRAASRP